MRCDGDFCDIDVTCLSISYSNPEVQERALTYQALPQLLNLLVTSSTPELLQRRVLYALGSLIRGHPLAIESFVANGGLDKISYNINDLSEAVLTKIITLLTDLLTFEVYIAIIISLINMINNLYSISGLA